VAEGLDLSNWVLLPMMGDYPIRQLVFYEKDFGWMAFWQLDPEMLESLWLKGLHDLGRQAVPLLNCTLASVSQLKKSTESFSRWPSS
jgi:hypothetical protein